MMNIMFHQTINKLTDDQNTFHLWKCVESNERFNKKDILLESFYFVGDGQTDFLDEIDFMEQIKKKELKELNLDSSVSFFPKKIGFFYR